MNDSNFISFWIVANYIYSPVNEISKKTTVVLIPFFYPSIFRSFLYFGKSLQITDKCALGMPRKSRLCLVGKQLSSLRHIFTKSIHHRLKILSFEVYRKKCTKLLGSHILSIYWQIVRKFMLYHIFILFS